MVVFLAVSILVHGCTAVWLTHWSWSPPQYDMYVEVPPVEIDLAEWVEQLEEVTPEEPEPEPEPEPAFEEPEPEPEPEREEEVFQEPEPEPLPPPPEPEPVLELSTVLLPDRPAYLRNPPPPYPREARREGWEGTVMVRVDVKADGTVGAVEVIQSSGYAILDDSAARTLARWRFAPARLAGQAVPATVEVPITFRLR